MSLKAKIEAVLFLTDKPIRAQAIARIVGLDVQIVRQTIIELIHDYEMRGGGLEIAQDNGYIIQVKDEYSQIIDEFLPVEMSAALVRTLSAIAIKQPVAQSEIIKIRGAGAYDHIRDLITRELVARKEEGGRSPILTTTRKFQEYFRLTGDARSLRQTLRRQERAGQHEIEPPATLSDMSSEDQEAGPAASSDEQTTDGGAARTNSENGGEDSPADSVRSFKGQPFSRQDGSGDNLTLDAPGQLSDTISEALP